MFKYIMLSAFLLSAGSSLAQSEDWPIDERRKYLMDHLSFYYVSDPNDETGKAYKLDNQAIASGKKEGEFWSDSTLMPLPQLVQALICNHIASDEKNRGDEFLQINTSDILKIMDKPVQIWLYNDNEPLEELPNDKYNPCTDLFGYVWPCASTFNRKEQEADFWAGYMHLGIENLTPDLSPNDSSFFDDPFTNAATTFLHMLMHTQDQSRLKAHMHHPYENDRWYETGENEQHFVVEAAPTLLSAYQEGIANIYALDYHIADFFRAYHWFYKNDYLLIETELYEDESDIAAKNLLYDQISEVAGKGDYIPDMPGHRGYKIQDLPARFLIHNEIIIALLFSGLDNRIDITQIITKTHAEIADPKLSSNPLATLFKYACEAGLPEKETVLTVLDLPDTQSKPYLLPLAYADFFTLCKAQNKTEFSEIFGDGLPQPWIDLYWHKARAKVKKAVVNEDGIPVRVEHYSEWFALIDHALNMQ